MTTKHSPLRQLQAQADKIAATLKAAERGEVAMKPAVEKKDSVKFGVVMDDKIITLEMPWETVRATSEAGLSAYVLRLMREQRDSVQ